MISVIIPIYNVEKYLKQCIDSVINQTYKNIEIILVNDGSTDRCGEICDMYSQLDNRIKLIHKKNGGLSDARNVGTEVATGEFIYYLDSDDYLEIDTIEKLITAQMKENADIVLSNFYYFYCDHEDEAKTIYKKNTILNNYEAMTALIRGDIETFAWGKLIKSQIAKKFLFPKGKLFEDHYWTHYIFSKANKVVVLSKSLVHYRQRNNSISYTFDLNRLDRIDGWIDRKKFLEKKYPDLVSTYMTKCSEQYVGMAWIILTRMRKNKLLALDKLRKHNSYFSFEKYCDGEQKKLIKALDKNKIYYIVLSILSQVKIRVLKSK